MPITPLHMGPALLIKAAGRRHFSFIVFGITQVFIDLESGYHFFLGNWPMHTFLHTLAGATVAAVICTLIGKPIGNLALRWWDQCLSPAQARWLGVEAEISWLAASSGAVMGAYSHVVLDGIMHSDVQPGAPWITVNPLLHWISISDLHWLCVIAAVVGSIILLPAWLKKRCGN